MDRTSVDWHGPMVAVITPFDDDGNIDEVISSLKIEDQKLQLDLIN